METGLTIQQVAQQTGLSIDTLRYYERIGLIDPVRRAPSGHRRYTQHDVSRIDLIIRLRATGMPRAQMVRFVGLRRQGPATATERRILLEQHARAVERSMLKLEEHMAALRRKIASIKELEARHEATSHPAHSGGSGERGVPAGAVGSEPP